MLLFPATAHGSRGVTEHGERGEGRRRRAHFLRARMPGGRGHSCSFFAVHIRAYFSTFFRKRRNVLNLMQRNLSAKSLTDPARSSAHFSSFSGLLVVGVSGVHGARARPRSAA